MTASVIVQEVTKSYGRIPALDGLSVTIEEGEIFGLLGANGAGKTTLIKVLVGASRLDSGTVQVLGYDPQKQKQQMRPQLGYMPQQPALYEDLTARANVRFFAQARRFADLEARVEEVLHFVNLADRADDPVFTFSGGMKQRVSLACALVHRPRLLLLDEPSTGVDPKLRESLWSHFHDLTQQGVTIVVSTHQMDEALHCDRVAVMRGGQVLASDTPRDLLQRGDAKVTIWNNEQAPQHLHLHNYKDELPQILGIAETVSRIDVREDTLEDIVLRLISEQEASHA